MSFRFAPSTLFLGAVTVLASPLSAVGQLPDAARDAWSAVVADWRSSVREEGVVGASMALVHDGRVVDLQTEGMAELAEGRSVDESTIYHWASITKTFTAIAIMQLRDRGMLSLDDPVVDYVPELREVRNPFGPMEEITIRHLLSHSAGFRGSTWPWAGDLDWHPHEPTEWSQLVAMIPYTEIRFAPGSRYSYSNPGIIFLGRVIEKVTGDVYEAYVDKNVFRPLDMRAAYFDVTPWQLRDARSNNYVVREGRPEAQGIDFNTGITVSNGGLNAPIADMARYLAFLMGSPVGADHEGVLRRSSLEEMWNEVVPIGDASPLGDTAMGLSFFLHRPGGRRVVGHTGSQKAFRSFFYLDPDSKVGVIAAFNTVSGDDTGPDVEELRNRFTRRVVEEVFPHFHH
jgi:CubicO group peptidase (beta-lactamase class C family)